MVVKKSYKYDLPNHEFILSFDSGAEADAFSDWLFTGPNSAHEKGGKKTFDDWFYRENLKGKIHVKKREKTISKTIG